MTDNEDYTRAIAWRASMAVKRFHVMRTLRTQTVGEHSGALATLIMQVLPDCSAALLKAALLHDFHERSTGDMPSTAKSAHPSLAAAMQCAEDSWNDDNGVSAVYLQLTEPEKNALCYCDYLELMLWAAEEIQLGNTYAWEAFDNIGLALRRLAPPSEAAGNIYESCKNLLPLTWNIFHQ